MTASVSSLTPAPFLASGDCDSERLVVRFKNSRVVEDPTGPGARHNPLTFSVRRLQLPPVTSVPLLSPVRPPPPPPTRAVHAEAAVARARDRCRCVPFVPPCGVTTPQPPTPQPQPLPAARPPRAVHPRPPPLPAGQRHRPRLSFRPSCDSTTASSSKPWLLAYRQRATWGAGRLRSQVTL